jgi:hypothetical protein
MDSYVSKQLLGYFLLLSYGVEILLQSGLFVVRDSDDALQVAFLRIKPRWLPIKRVKIINISNSHSLLSLITLKFLILNE